MIRTYPADYSVVFVGDASMSPYEIIMPGGSVEHWNEEPGQVWMERLLDAFSQGGLAEPRAETAMDLHAIDHADAQILADRMFPLTLEGIDRQCGSSCGSFPGAERLPPVEGFSLATKRCLCGAGFS